MWLGIMAVVSLVEFLALMAAGVMAWRLYNKTLSTIDQIEQRQIAPLTEQVHLLITEVRDVTSKVRQAEASVRAVVTAVEDKARAVAAIAERGWPVLGAARAVGAAFKVLSRPRPGHAGTVLTSTRHRS
jgi:uncharacterized protein YoxC